MAKNTAKKDIFCTLCGGKIGEIIRESSIVAGKYCSLKCYTGALLAEERRQRREKTRRARNT